ncbi:MAG: hypothetical protein K6T65_10610 [Peptococcaceae bacterium]|nr:hypothetical protein [Peptococcaceae bacterium]
MTKAEFDLIYQQAVKLLEDAIINYNKYKTSCDNHIIGYYMGHYYAYLDFFKLFREYVDNIEDIKVRDRFEIWNELSYMMYGNSFLI